MADAHWPQETRRRSRKKSWERVPFVPDSAREFIWRRSNQNYHHTHGNKNRHELHRYTHGK